MAGPDFVGQWLPALNLQPRSSELDGLLGLRLKAGPTPKNKNLLNFGLPRQLRGYLPPASDLLFNRRFTGCAGRVVLSQEAERSASGLLMFVKVPCRCETEQAGQPSMLSRFPQGTILSIVHTLAIGSIKFLVVSTCGDSKIVPVVLMGVQTNINFQQ